MKRSNFIAYSVERIADSKLSLSAKRYPLNAKTLFYLILTFCIFNSIGCTTIEETAKGVAGLSTQALEQGRKDAITKTFDYDYFTCYAKTWDTLKRIKAYPYAHGIKRHMIAIYISEEDTTPVGLFFKEIDAAHTQIEVSSQSLYAKELISKRVFLGLEEPIDTQAAKEKE